MSPNLNLRAHRLDVQHFHHIALSNFLNLETAASDLNEAYRQQRRQPRQAADIKTCIIFSDWMYRHWTSERLEKVQRETRSV